MNQSRLVQLGLALLLAWSFLLRAWVATPELSANRFWDERYGLENIRSLLAEAEIRPANGFHPSLSYLPQAALLGASEALHRAAGWEAFAIFRGDGFSPTAYLLCRLLQAVFGTLSIYLTYRIGRRLHSAGVGITAALFLAVIEWHLRQSVIYKPDILLVLTSLLAFLWSLDAWERQTWRAYLRAGGAIGLALASKFNAGPIALPLVVAALANGGWRQWRRWSWLALAAATAAAVFLILNPFFLLDPDLYAKDFSRTLKNYAIKGKLAEGSHGQVAWHGLITLFSPSFHGGVVGTLALLGILGVTLSLARGTAGDRVARTGWLMALTYVFGYGLLYSLSTTNLSPHNWLPVTPYTSLFAAWTVFRAWSRLAARWPVLAARRVAAAVAAALAALLVLPPNAYAYREVVPSTWTLAQSHLSARLRPLTARVIYYEDLGRRFVLKHGPQDKAVSRAVKGLNRVPPAALDRADAEIFHGDVLSGPRGDFYRRRIAAAAAHQVARFGPAAFRARGPALVVLAHPWRKAGRPMRLALSQPPGAPDRLAGPLPDGLAAGEVVSLEIYLPKVWRQRGIGPVLVCGERLALASVGAAGERVFSDRFRIAEPEAELVVHLRRAGRPGEPQVRVRLHRWRPPRSV